MKINAVLIKGFNDDEIISLENLTYKYPVDVRFIELMSINDSIFYERENFLSYSEVLKKFPDVEKNFCSECNRLRLTADGKIKPCLHTLEEISVKGMSEKEMKEAFIMAIMKKPKMHPEFFSGTIKNKRTMNQIGG